MTALTIDTIRGRRSVRSYDGRPLDQSLVKTLESRYETFSPGLFGGRTRFALVVREERGRLKMGTYGLISNVPAYIAGSIQDSPMANEDFGYSAEGLILEATRLGLGTCWIGGLFDRTKAAEATGGGAGFLVPAIIATGYPAETRSIADRLIASVSSERGRKDPALLFFDAATGGACTMDSGNPWTEVLEALRLAPSASNKQPWRVFVETGTEKPRFHLYLDEDPKYNRMFGAVRLQNVDMGIAMRHFEVAARSLNLPGSWTRLSPGEAGEESRRVTPWQYIASWCV